MYNLIQNENITFVTNKTGPYVRVLFQSKLLAVACSNEIVDVDDRNVIEVAQFPGTSVTFRRNYRWRIAFDGENDVSLTKVSRHSISMLI